MRLGTMITPVPRRRPWQLAKETVTLDRLSGGRVILGNFHPRNPSRVLMDQVLDWHLVHRDEADMNRLLQSSKFGRPCSRVVFEEEGIDLFAECRKL